METFRLSAEGIIAAVEKTGTFFTDCGTDREDALRIRLTAEEILLSFQQEFGDKALLELYLEKRMGTPRVVFRIPGASFDPFGNLSEEDYLMHNLMENSGTVPVWNYRRSCNEIVFTIGKKKKLSSSTMVLISIVLGIGIGLLSRLLPGTLAHDICTKWVNPVQDTIMGLLCCLSALFILFSVSSGICGMGDVTTFNRVGRRLIFSMLLALLIPLAIASFLFPFFFPLAKGSGGNADLSVLWQMIISIVPTNIVETFSSGNTMQIIFLAMFASVILLIMGPKAQQLVDIISQLSDLFQQLIQGVITLMPLVVFTSLFSLIADGDIAQLVAAYKYPLFVFISCLLLLLIKVPLTAFKHHISPRLLIKKLLPTFLIALSTSSSSAALPENINTCENRLGIDRQVVNVGIPLGQTIYMPSTAFLLMIGCLCAAQIFDVPITLSTYIVFAFTIYIVTIATPPVPGGMFATFTLLMAQLGIPSAAFAFIIALNPIIDRIATCTYIAGLQMELVDISASLDLLDKEKLRADE